MPKCKNDNTSYYTGKEPSPKGLGYCAHAMKINTVKKGKDGKRWIVSSKTKRWVKYKRTLSKNKKPKVGKVKDPVSIKISKLIKEGYPRKQAVAIALSMKNNKSLGPRGGYKRKRS